MNADLKTWNDVADWMDLHMGDCGDWFYLAICKPCLDDILAQHSNKLVKSRTALDVGCGNGHVSRYLARKHYDVIGIDISEKMIHNAKNRSSKNIEYFTGDILNKILPIDIFDVIILNNVLQDTLNYKEIINKLMDYTNSSTILIFITRHPCFHPKRDNLGWKLDDINGETITSGYGMTNLIDSKVAYEAKYYMIDDYFSNLEVIRDWNGMQLHSYNRMMSEYINAFIESGWRLDRFEEPQPAELMCNSYTKLLLRRIPEYIVTVWSANK